MRSLGHLLSAADYDTALRYAAWAGDNRRLRDPDLVIEPDGSPYIYRWHVVERNTQANVYFHIQVADDPERPLHDHPWDCTSVILAGGYREVIDDTVMPYEAKPEQRRFVTPRERLVRPGQVVHRKAEAAHRLFLAPGQPYSMSLFTTGPKVREWGFWCPLVDHPEQGHYCQWHPQTELIHATADGRSLFKEPTP